MLFKCDNCGIIIDEKKPKKCPYCEKENTFSKLPEEKEEKILRYRDENEILMDILAVLTNGIELSLEGMENSKNEKSKKIFGKILSDFPELRAMIFNLLKENVNDEKWG